MTAPVLFLLGALTLSMLGGLLVWMLSRPRKERFGESIHTFRRDLHAIAPPPPPKPQTKPGPRPSQTGKQ